LSVGLQRLLPVSAGLQLDALGVAGCQVQGIQLGTLGVHLAGQRQCDRGLFGRQAGATRQLIALEEVTLGIQHKLVELQRVGQRAHWFECVGAYLQLRRQVFGQGL